MTQLLPAHPHHGVLSVTRSGGNPDMLIGFRDKLYWTNLPPDNTDVVGEVRYTFMALNGPCTSAMTPYQEVASGADNEKFNGDFGGGIPPLMSYGPDVTIDKDGTVTVTPGDTVEYTIDLANEGAQSAGLPLYAVPLVISDTLPVSTTLSRAIDAPGYTVLYSIDGGATYTTTYSTGDHVTNVQLWMDDELAAGASAPVTVTATVDAAIQTPVIENCAAAGLGNGSPFAENCHTTLVEGTNSIGDRVWQDENGNGIQDTGEISISNVSLMLYWDRDGDGELDADDMALTTTTTSMHRLLQVQRSARRRLSGRRGLR